MITATDGERDACRAHTHSGSDGKGSSFVASLRWYTCLVSPSARAGRGEAQLRRGARVSGDRAGRRPATLVPSCAVVATVVQGYDDSTGWSY
jgi:hypothetical protein